ncbi:thiamine pyrophosphate-binding protein [Zwartia panacis]|uniref:thiamine pyrophosphate-binding protein n=1 Tax=Zwartia panacis TaxID=2683345 RepID=UPI0025B41CD4|nr:thiamine pyrophosphate-dependent enzyme [Zwartia panacis]MDN4017578.1 thiamine pyrophosphate-binding protein [Zwartia panacis]
MTIQKMTGRQAFIKLLLDEGVTHLFGNPGTTELAIMEAVPQFPELTYVLGLQESIVVGMADGFARASNQLVACNLHCAPGLGHAMGAIYNAKFSGSPLLITAGQYEVGYGLQEPLLYEPLVPIAAPLVKWAFEVTRIEDLPRVIRRAAKIARTPPMGPVFISLPGSVLDEEAEIEFGFPTIVDAGVRPSDSALKDLAQKLLAAKKPVIVAGREIANADLFNEACELAELLGAAVYQESVPYNARYPSSHPTCMGDLTRNQKKVRQTLEQYDFLLCLGADLLRMSPMSTVDPLPPEMPVMHITERDWELGKNYSTATAVRADVKETLLALLPVLRDLRTAEQAKHAQARLADLATRNWTANRAKTRAEVQSSASSTPIDQRYLVSQLVDVLPKDVIVVDETLTAAPAIAAMLPMDDPQAYYGLASGGLGFGMAGAVGVALAQPERPVVAVIGDGSAMYSIQSLWTAAHLKLNITYVIINNRSYRIIKERLLAMRGTDDFVAMDMNDPAIDFAGVAKSMGMSSQVVTDPTQIAGVLQAAMASPGPQLVEVIVSRGFGE